MTIKSVGVLSTAALLLQLACLLDAPCVHAVVLTPRRIPATRFEVARRLRGGQDDAGEEEEEEEEEEALDDLETSVAGVGDGDDALETNPFLSGAGAAGDASQQLSGLSDTLKDPSLVREALKELQDPAAQARMRAMMEDPEFQKSMQQYVDQISKDPQFEQQRRHGGKSSREEAGVGLGLYGDGLLSGPDEESLGRLDTEARRLYAEARRLYASPFWSLAAAAVASMLPLPPPLPPLMPWPALRCSRLRKQTEELMQEPDFVEQITKAFSGIGEPPKGGADSK